MDLHDAPSLGVALVPLPLEELLVDGSLELVLVGLVDEIGQPAVPLAGLAPAVRRCGRFDSRFPTLD